MAENERNYENECGDHGGISKQTGEPCGRPAGWGTDFDDGKCKHHRGTNDDGSSHEENTNAVSHGLYAKTNSFYQDVIDGDLQELCDEIFADYLEQYKQIHGEPPMGHEARLFEISVNHIKIIHADNWAVDKPDDLQSGSPIVDREERKKGVADRVIDEIRYKESVTVATQQKLRREDRAWLRDFGLLEDPESQKADAFGDLSSIIADLS